jgi:hypothetical protein
MGQQFAYEPLVATSEVSVGMEDEAVWPTVLEPCLLLLGTAVVSAQPHWEPRFSAYWSSREFGLFCCCHRSSLFCFLSLTHEAYSPSASIHGSHCPSWRLHFKPHSRQVA